MSRRVGRLAHPLTGTHTVNTHRDTHTDIDTHVETHTHTHTHTRNIKTNQPEKEKISNIKK